MSEPKPKSFAISKRAVWEAYRRVKANKGVAGVDGESIEEFDRDLEGNLYKLWNRLSSGSYFPPPVRAVQIPKKGGRGVRTLGVPTVIAYHKVAQDAFGFAGRHTPLPPAARQASAGALCPSRRRDSRLRVRGRAAGQRGPARGCDRPWSGAG